MPGWSGAGIDGDLFGKIYTYQELQEVERPQKSTPAQRAMFADLGRDLTRPAHWPTDTEIDPGVWVGWLPKGWGQGIKDTYKDGVKTGKTLKCYISPADHTPVKRFFHKEKVEEYCSKAGLPGLDSAKGSEELRRPERIPNETTGKKFKSVHDAPPNWPDWDLPKTWRIAFKQLPSGPHRIYIPPGQDEGFLYQRTCVEQYLSVGKSLVRFAISKPMAERSAEAAAKGTSGRKQRKSKPNRVQVDDYRESANLLVINTSSPESSLSAMLADAGAPSNEANALESSIPEIHSFLAEKKFDNVELIILVLRESSHKFEQMIGGVFYRRPEAFAERPYYQKITKIGAHVRCVGIFMFWSEMTRCWKVAGRINDEDPGIARCFDDRQMPAGCGAAKTGGTRWMMLREDFLDVGNHEEANVAQENRSATGAQEDLEESAEQKSKKSKAKDTIATEETPAAVLKAQKSKATDTTATEETSAAEPKAKKPKVADTTATEETKAVSSTEPDSKLATLSATLASEWADDDLEVHTQKILAFAESTTWPPWLPHDWGITNLEGGKKVFVVPGWKSMGRMRYFLAKADVDRVLSTGLPKVRSVAGRPAGLLKLPV